MPHDSQTGSALETVQMLLDETLDDLLSLKYEGPEEEKLLSLIFGWMTALESLPMTDEEAHQVGERYWDLPEIIAAFGDEEKANYAAQLVVDRLFQCTPVGEDIAYAPLLTHPELQ